MFLNVSQDEFEDDGDYKISGSESSLDTNDDILATAENPADAAEMGNVEIDVDECDSDDDECRPLSPVEKSEVHDDIAYFISSATSSKAITSQLFEGKDPTGKYMAEMDRANSIILSSVKQIISTLFSALYALSIHWTGEFSLGYLSILDFIPSSTSLPCLTLELYLSANLRSYTWDRISARRDTYPQSIFYRKNGLIQKFEGLMFK